VDPSSSTLKPPRRLGAWRTFVSLRTRTPWQRSSAKLPRDLLSRLGAEYRALADEIKVSLREIGRVADVARQWGGGLSAGQCNYNATQRRDRRKAAQLALELGFNRDTFSLAIGDEAAAVEGGDDYQVADALALPLPLPVPSSVAQPADPLAIACKSAFSAAMAELAQDWVHAWWCGRERELLESFRKISG
jgi:hypothetical protein